MGYCGAGEAHGVHYHFVSADTMTRAIEQGIFLEHAEVHGNRYGTSKECLAAVAATGRVPILDVDVQGIRQLKTSMESMHSIFVAPPSLQHLEERLRARYVLSCLRMDCDLTVLSSPNLQGRNG